MDDGYLSVRATVHLQGLPVGATARVDPNRPYIAALLEGTFLVPIETQGASAAVAATPSDDASDG